MNKFSVTGYPATDETKPVLYKLHLANKYYLHKGKILKDSVNRFLDDVNRGIRGLKCQDDYSSIVEYCKLHPQVYKVSIEVIVNAEPDKILKKEAALFKAMKNDAESLNRTDLQPYKPEWMIKQSLQKRCENPVLEGIVNGKKLKFKFCPNCGRLNK